MTTFWIILAGLYLILAIVTFLSGRAILKNFALLKQTDALISINERGEEVGLESTLHRAYKAILMTDTIGFVFAALAAIISACVS